MTTYPNALASGSNLIASSLLFTGSQYVTLGTPTALTNVLAINAEFTIIVRTCRTASGSTGQIICQADEHNTTFSLQSTGGSAISGSIGGNSFTTGPGTVQNPTWNCVALVNRNASGTFMSRMVLDGNAATAEVATGSEVCTKDIMIGARRNASNADSIAWYSGNIGTISIYAGALTDAQIHFLMGYITPNEMINQAATYAAGVPLLAYYPCNEASGTVLNDVYAGINGTASASGLQSTAQFPIYPAVTVGDSRSAGDGSQTDIPYGDQVVTGGSGVRNGRSVYVYAFPGQNVAYIAAQLALSTYQPFLNWTQIYMVGIHDLGNNSGVVSFLATQIATLPHKRFLVMGDWGYGVGTNGTGTPSSAGLSDWGTTIRQQLDSQNAVIQAIYGVKWLDDQSLLTALNSIPGNNDTFQLRTPVNVCADDIHILNNGQVNQSQAADVRMRSLGY